MSWTVTTISEAHAALADLEGAMEARVAALEGATEALDQKLVAIWETSNEATDAIKNDLLILTARVQFLFDHLKETPDGLHAWPHSEVVQEVPGVGNINMETGEPV